MEKRTNPLDTDAAQPIKTDELTASKQEWYADKERIIADSVARVDKAITKVEDWSNVANSLVGLLGQIVPIIDKLASPVGIGADANAARGILADVKAKLSKMVLDKMV